MKKSLIVLAIPLAVMAMSAFSALPAQAQTVMANGTVCPAGLVCTPIITNCPANYTCAPIPSATGATNASSGSTSAGNTTTNGTSLLSQLQQINSSGSSANANTNSTVTGNTNSITNNSSNGNLLGALSASSTNTTTPVPVSSIVIHTPDSKGLLTDPYCSGYQSNGRFFSNDCVSGEAETNSPYVNPWVTLDNLTGMIFSSKNDGKAGLIGRDGDNNTIHSTNYCKSAISISNAIALEPLLTSMGVQTNFVSTSRLLVMGGLSLDYIENRAMTQIVGHKGYWWDGTPAYLPNGSVKTLLGDYVVNVQDYSYNKNDWTNPKFQDMFKTMQLDSSWLYLCLDSNYVSNFPQWASHFESAMQAYRSKGILQ